MTDEREPTGYELQRSIERLEKGVSNGLTEIKLLIAGLVSRDLFDFEAKVQNEKIKELEQRLDEHTKAESSAKQRFWLNVFIPLLGIAAGVAVALFA